MTCGACQRVVPEPTTPIGGLVICPHCLRSLVAATGAPSTAAATLALTPEQLEALRAQRKVARKALAS